MTDRLSDLSIERGYGERNYGDRDYGLVSAADDRAPGRDKATERAFDAGLSGHLPNLTAFARSLTRDAVRADDLVQETAAKALSNRDKFEPGTNQRAWLFAILRNTFLSDIRRRKREVDIEQAPEPSTAGIPSQEANLSLSELKRALSILPESQRVAILMVGAEGLSYEEAAKVGRCAVGTIKSRVSRARARLESLLDGDDAAFE